MLSYADTILEIERLERLRDSVESALLHETDPAVREHLCTTHDGLSDEIAPYRRDLDDYEQEMALRAGARTRSYGQWVTR